MAWLSGYYRRPKNPWIGAIVVFVIGPFGFLYHSWKAMFYLLVAFPLWFVFLRHTPFDLTNPVPHYLVLMSMAVLAWFQIKGQRNKLENDHVVRFAQSLLATDYDRKVFAEFLRQHRELTAKMGANPFLSDSRDDPWPRWTLGMLFSSYGTVLGDRGNLKEASQAFAFSMDFFDENPHSLGRFGRAEPHEAGQNCWPLRKKNIRLCSFGFLLRVGSAGLFAE
jgi:hypothetical protein